MIAPEIATALARGIHVAATLSLFGSLVFLVCTVPAGEALPCVNVTRIARTSGVVALIAGVVWLIAVANSIADADSLLALRAAVPAVALETSFGRLVCVRLVLIAVVLSMPSRWILSPCLAAAAVALQPLLGHAGAMDGSAGWTQIVVEAAHVLAAGAWFGGLVPLMLCVARAPAPLAAALCERFTPIGLVAVGTIALTAVPQAVTQIGGIGGLFGTRYGHFALLKLGLFCLALTLACVNRLVLTARLLSLPHAATRRVLTATVLVETVSVLAVILAASAMASSSPAVHDQPVWPFPWRPSAVAWQEPELRGELLRLIGVSAAAAIMIGGSLVLRRWRIAAFVLGFAAVSPFVSALGLLLVEAYPTSCAASPTGFSVLSIARGQTLFGPNCAGCHDPRNGTKGAADLTAPHLWEHSDGELFWWLTAGFADPRGERRMPAFAPALSEDDRWALIDFIRARSIGLQAHATGTWSPPVAAPEMPLICGGNQTTSAGIAPLIAWIVAGAEIAAPPEPDVTAIRLGRGTAAPPTGRDCAAQTPDAWVAFAILAGVAPEHLDRYQAIVDGRLWLRAWLPPDAGPERLTAAIRAARESAVSGGVSGHRH